MKICYIGNAQSIHMQRWAKWFAERKHEVHLITDVPAEIDGVKIHPVKGRENPIFFFVRMLQIKKIVWKINPDILHAHQIFGYGLFGVFSGFYPLIVSPWGSDITSFPKKSILHKLFIKYILKRANLVQCMDESLAERAKNLIGGRGNIHIIKEGVDPDLFKPKKVEKNKIIRILYLRKSQEPYGVETLLYAIPEVIKKNENVGVLILKSGKELNKTFDIVKKLGVESYVKFIDAVPNDKIPEFMNGCDIYVDTFYREIPGSGIGKTALEAMSCELPVVLSNTSGMELYVKNEVNGLIYKGEDFNSLANAIIRLMGDEELREKLGENAREYVLKNQDWNKNMKLMESFYEKLTKGGAKQ